MSSDDRRVVITGIGVVTRLGRGLDLLWRALLGGRLDEAVGYSPPENLDREAASLLGRCSLLAADAAIQAVEDARLPFTANSAPLIGVSFGSENADPDSRQPGAPATSVARVLGIAGPVLSHAGPSSGLVAIGEALEMIRRNAAPVAIAGASDAPGATASSEQGRPFDAACEPASPTDAAAAFVLEDADLARERGAHVYADVLGHGIAFSRATVMKPAMNHVDAARAMRAALLRADVLQGEVEVVFASARGDRESDTIEAKALAELWGPNVDRLSVISVLGATGDALAASGPLSLAVAARALSEGIVPPTFGCREPDKSFSQLDIVVGDSRNYRFDTALVNAFSAADNVALVIRQPS